MPSWPARLHIGSPSSSKLGPSSRQPGPRSPTAKPIPNGNSIQDPPLIGVPLLVPPTGHGRNEARNSQHGRSRSHPYIPDLDSYRDNVDIAEELRLGSGGPTALGGHAAGPASRDIAATQPGGAIHMAEKDLISGKCATCDSIVRWPRHLDVFRCTVCLMVNDLKPIPTTIPEATSGSKESGGARISSSPKPSKGMSPFLILLPKSLTSRCSSYAFHEKNYSPHRRMHRSLLAVPDSKKSFRSGPRLVSRSSSRGLRYTLCVFHSYSFHIRGNLGHLEPKYSSSNPRSSSTSTTETFYEL